MLATFVYDITATFLSVMDTYAHHENRSRIRKVATLAIILAQEKEIHVCSAESG